MAGRSINWLNKLAIGSLRANRTRNVMVIISTAIITTVIATSLIAAVSIVLSAEKSVTDQLGTTAQCSLNNPTKKQVEKLRSLSYIKDVGYEIVAGKAFCQSVDIQFKNVEDQEWLNHIKPTLTTFYGALPKQADEIVLSEKLLDSFGISKPYIGKSLTLSCSSEPEFSNSQVYKKFIIAGYKKFIIAGWYTDKRLYDRKNFGIIYVSEKFAASNGKTVQNSGSANISFKENAFIKEVGIIHRAFKEPRIGETSALKIAKLENDLPITKEQKVDKIRRTFGYVYNPQKLEVYLLIVLPVFFCGLILIFDCFFLTIFKDLRECGLLMAVGASLKQLTSILWRQALVLGFVGISAGLLLSIVTSLYAVPIYLTNIIGENTEFVWTFSSYLIAAAVAFFTVALCSQTVQIYLGRVSVLESIRSGSEAKNSEYFKKHNKLLRIRLPWGKKRTNYYGVYKLAVKNCVRNAYLNQRVVISLFIAATVFLLVSAVVSGINPKEFAAEKMDGHDFTIINKTFYTNYSDPQYAAGIFLQRDIIEDSLLAGIKQQTGVMQVDKLGFLPIVLKTEEGEDEPSGLWFVNTNSIKSFLSEDGKQIDMNMFEKGGTCLINSEPDIYSTNPEISFYNLSDEKIENINHNAQSNATLDQIMGESPNLIAVRPTMPYFIEDEDTLVPLNVGGYLKKGINVDMPSAGELSDIYVNDSLAKRLNRVPITAKITVDVDKENINNIEKYLEEAIGGNPLIDFRSKARLIRMMESTKYAVNILGNMLAAMIIIIGAFELISITMISTRIRINEFAMLRSIGMSKRQMYKMLAVEGAINSAILLLLIMTLGNWLVKQLYSAFSTTNYHMASFTFAFMCLGIVFPFIFIPIILYSTGSRKSIATSLQEDA